MKKDKTVVEKYIYDANSNRQSATLNGVTANAFYTLDDQLEVYGDNTYRYDDDGYLIEKLTPNGKTTYEYGTLGELHIVSTPSGTIAYKHDALSQRVSKEVNGTVIEKYLWEDITTLLAVYDGFDNIVQRFEYIDERMPISMTVNADKYYLHYDQVGSLRVVSDINKNIVKEIVYDSYGNIISDTNPNFKVPFGFAGGLYDQDTKLSRFGYRDYDAYTGKWTSKDPIGFDGGDNNLYGYVLNNPIRSFDANGLRGGRIGVRTRTRTNLGDTFAAALAAAAASAGDAISDAFPDTGAKCGSTCDEKYRLYKKCSELYDYSYTSENDAFNNGFGGSKYSKKGKRATVTSGPCSDKSGNNLHINVYSTIDRDYVGAITSCQCCDDSSGDAILKTKYNIVQKIWY